MSELMGRCRRKDLELLRSQLELERSSFVSTWRQVGDLILPRRPRFFVTDTNRGDRRTNQIIDSTATFAAGTLRSGMMAGVTSPARPWFRLTTPDPDMAEYGPVKEWLDVVTRRMNTAFLRSNLYNVLPIVYGDMGVFATGCMFMEEDPDDVVRFYPFPIGSYMIANDERLKVAVLLRDFRMTVRQLIGKFATKDSTGRVTDWSNFSTHVKKLYEEGALEQWVEVCHVIKPNEEYDPQKLHSRFKRFSSTYYERGTSGAGQASYMDPASEERCLSRKGFDFFPGLVPRWEVTGEDAWGTSCPGFTALGDIRALQTMQKRKAEAIEKMVRPPMQGPPSMRNQKTSILPGDMNYVPDNSAGIRPAMTVNVDLNHLLVDIQDTQGRVRRSFHEDLFLMFATSDRRQITAREIDERHEEKLLALGPVLEQLNQDLLDPLIDNTFFIMNERGDIPEAPDELQGLPLKVEYTSIMAQAQKLVSLGGIERFAGFASQVIAVNPEAADKVDMEEMLDVYGDAVGIAPKIVRPDEVVAQMKQQRAQAQAAAQQAEALQSISQSARNLGGASTAEDTALGGLIDAASAGQIV